MGIAIAGNARLEPHTNNTMHSKLLLASTFGAAAAFQAPAASKATSSLKAVYNPSSFDDVQSLPGILEPTGFFDPAGFSEGVSSSELKRYREAELTHGRVAMLATLGFLIGESGFTPLFEGKISGIGINQFAGADGLLAGHPPLHRRAGDVPCAPRLDGADGAGELLPAPPGLHPRRPRLRPARPQARGPRGAQGDADQGAPARPPRYARGRRHDRPGAPDGRHALLSAETARPRLLRTRPRHQV